MRGSLSRWLKIVGKIEEPDNYERFTIHCRCFLFAEQFVTLATVAKSAVDGDDIHTGTRDLLGPGGTLMCRAAVVRINVMTVLRLIPSTFLASGIIPEKT
jgi:hypothetical protein